MILTFRPIKVWPDHWRPADAVRPASPFTATYAATLELLDRELTFLQAREVFLQLDASPSDVRIDGQLRANAKVDHPGVILTIETRHLGALVYDCDEFTRNWGANSGPAWHHNLRAVALGLEALRKVERYGIAKRGQQYAGYRELPSATPMPAGTMTAEQAAVFIADHAAPAMGIPIEDLAAEILGLEGGGPWLRDAFKVASKQLHPDVGGDPEQFRRLVQARDLLCEDGAGAGVT